MLLAQGQEKLYPQFDKPKVFCVLQSFQVLENLEETVKATSRFSILHG